LNKDDRSYDYLRSIAAVNQVSYSLYEGADIRAEAIEYLPDGLRFIGKGRDNEGGNFSLLVETKLIGEYNVANCLAALAVAVGVLGLPLDAVRLGIGSLPGIPGRMERIEIETGQDRNQDFLAYVDFAHTPNALLRSLQAARQLTRGRVIAVFGSAGLRDRAKRRMMAEVSAKLADISILTAEDPRTETLEMIIDEMAQGARSQGAVEGSTFWRIPDRGRAIRFAVELAQPGDLVVALGKGHEQSMCFGEMEYPWDDRVAVRAALAERFGLPGPAMPYLPTQVI